MKALLHEVTIRNWLNAWISFSSFIVFLKLTISMNNRRSDSSLSFFSVQSNIVKLLICILKGRYSFFEILARVAITHLTDSTTSTTTKPLIKLTI
ncbi:hypothetical protein A9Y76_07260 [Ralstonia insidiosa]|uniref:Uncharacterized protein n=1 Tax=Ralstonia insidiosa TaxID=190721 RepID=A0A191ZW19_9RALS|nr:hypothetical protein A9Y76_07260 [Ralstonia insidiosa]